MTTPTNTPTSPMDELEKRTKDVMESLGFTLVTISADYHEPFDSYFMGNDGLSIESAKKLVQLITSREQSIIEQAKRDARKSTLREVLKLLRRTNSMFSVGILEGTIEAHLEDPEVDLRDVRLVSPTQLKGDNNE